MSDDPSRPPGDGGIRPVEDQPRPPGAREGHPPHAEPSPRARSWHRGPLRHREFRLLFAGQGVSVLGDAIFPVALAFAVLDELDGSAADLGLVLLAQAAPMTALVLVAGVWADRLPRNLLMVVSDVGRLVCQAVLAVLLLTDRAELWHAVILVALYGACEALFRPAVGGLLPQLVPKDELQRANALMAGAINAGHIGGPVAAGALVVFVGAGAAVAVDAATFAVSLACVIALRPPAVTRVVGEAATRFTAEIREGLREIRDRRWLRTALPLFSLYHLVSLPCTLALGPALVDAELGGAGDWGIISASFGIGAIVGSATAFRVHPDRPMVAALGGLSLGALQPVVIALGGSTPVIAAGLAVGGFGIAYGYAVWEATLGREIPEDRMSRIVSVDFFATAGIMPLGYAIVGPLGEGVGLEAVMIVAGLAVWLLILAALRLPGIRRLDYASSAS